DRPCPNASAERPAERPELELHVEPRAREAPRTETSVAEIRAAQVDAADAEAFKLPRLVPLADDQFGAAAADVDDQRRPRAARRMMRDAEIDQPRLLDTRDHVDGMAVQRLRGRRQERVGV